MTIKECKNRTSIAPPQVSLGLLDPLSAREGPPGLAPSVVCPGVIHGSRGEA